MNSQRLAKHYDQLTPRERFSLLVAAGTRGDWVEHRRLMQSAPTGLFRVRSHSGYLDAFHEVAADYLIHQLDVALLWWKGWIMFLDDSEPSDTFARGLRLLAYLFVIRRQAWQRLCEEYQIDGSAVLAGYRAFEATEELADDISQMACTAEEAAATVRRKHPDAPTLTADDILASMKQRVETRAAWWM